MRYAKPQITGKFKALSTIKSEKGVIPSEAASHDLTAGAAYQSDE